MLDLDGVLGAWSPYQGDVVTARVRSWRAPRFNE
jgi:hypothetical protein